jgi:hypothetical protein
MTDENAHHRPEEDAARLGLVVVGEAAALQSGDEAALDASIENIRETIEDMIDEPLTERQEEVVERLASAGGTLTAGLSGALAAQTGRPVDDVLEGAARSIIWQERLSADRDRDRPPRRPPRRRRPRRRRGVRRAPTASGRALATARGNTRSRTRASSRFPVPSDACRSDSCSTSSR